MSAEDDEAARLKAVHNERTKLTARYLNTAAGGLFTAGVVAPLIAAALGGVGHPLASWDLASGYRLP